MTKGLISDKKWSQKKKVAKLQIAKKKVKLQPDTPKQLKSRCKLTLCKLTLMTKVKSENQTCNGFLDILEVYKNCALTNFSKLLPYLGSLKMYQCNWNLEWSLWSYKAMDMLIQTKNMPLNILEQWKLVSLVQNMVHLNKIEF